MVRLPTVVNWAGWKWVNPKVGRSRYWAAKLERREMRMPREWMRYVRPWRIKIKSALLRGGSMISRLILLITIRPYSVT